MSNSQFDDAFLLRAAVAIARFKKLRELISELDEDKEYFREEAYGQSLVIPVDGLGQILVKTPVPEKTFSAIDFDEEAYNKLPAATRKALETKGVVRRVRRKTPAREAAVVITPNI